MSSKTQKCFFIVPDLRPGGAQSFFARLSSVLSDEGLDVTLVVLTSAYDPEKLAALSARTVALNARRISTSFFKLAALLFKERPQVVYSTIGYTNLLVGLLAYLLPLPIRYIAREANLIEEKLREKKVSPLYLTLYSILYSPFERIILQSLDMRADFLSYFPQFEGKITVINNSCPSPKFKSLTNSSPGIRLVSIGKLEHQKGYDRLIRLLKESGDKEITWDIYGEGSLKKDIQALIDELELGDRVRLMGLTPVPQETISKYSYLALPSRYEGFPNVVVEAFSVGVPVMAFRAPGGINELVTPETGLYLEENEAGLATLRTIGKRTFDSEAIKRYFHEKFSMEVIAKRYRDIIEMNG